MSTYGPLPFIAVFSLVVALPGPGVAVIVARSLARGTAATHPCIAGMALADVVCVTCTATGLAALAENAYTLVRHVPVIAMIAGTVMTVADA